MKRVLFAIFAHPDDESFGPSGTLTKLVRDGWDVHVICVTDGGNNDPTNKTTIIRKNELQAASDLMGVHSTRMIGFSDGTLCNQNYHEVALSIKSHILECLDQNAKTDAEISFMTFERHGLTGHLDHIAVSFVVTHLYTTMQDWASEVSCGWLKYFCLCNEQKAEDISYFVYSPRGYKEEDIDETVDVSDIIELKKRIIMSHSSQEDAKRMLSLGDHLLSREHFMHYK